MLMQKYDLFLVFPDKMTDFVYEEQDVELPLVHKGDVVSIWFGDQVGTYHTVATAFCVNMQTKTISVRLEVPLELPDRLCTRLLTAVSSAAGWRSWGHGYYPTNFPYRYNNT